MLERLEEELQSPQLWEQPDEARRLLKQMTSLKEEVEGWQEAERKLQEIGGLFQLAVEEGEKAFITELQAEVEDLERRLDQQEKRLLLGGEYDGRDAILSIHAGAGGTESQDWVEMLLRMYLRWAESHGYKTRLVDDSPGEEAGLKSATVEVEGSDAYGYLKAERGVHRLVRLSPFDAAHRRHTSFALVEVLPAVNGDISVEIAPDDLRIDTFRASGAGGQHVNKTSSAVRITHLPSGIVATCQNERSQAQNRATAMRVLKARLLAREEEKREIERARLKGKHVSAGWGNQIRSYVIHPYALVKDHRTRVEVGNVQRILDGDLDAFMEAYLRQSVEEAAHV